MAQGLERSAIATQMGLGSSVLKDYIEEIYDLGITNRTAATYLLLLHQTIPVPFPRGSIDPPELSHNEQLVFYLSAVGYSEEQTAQLLSGGNHWVKAYRQEILAKFTREGQPNVSMPEAVSYAFSERLFRPSPVINIGGTIARLQPKARDQLASSLEAVKTPPAQQLEPRQVAVIAEFAKGKDLPEIAGALHSSRETITRVSREALRRLGINTEGRSARTAGVYKCYLHNILHPSVVVDHGTPDLLTPALRLQFALACLGLDQNQAAEASGLAVRTVNTCRQHIVQALHANNMREAVAIAFKYGILRQL
jgi:DNA-binding NarL/FixJ family response regulator